MAKNRVRKSAQQREAERKAREKEAIIKMAAERATKQLEDKVATEAAIDNSKVLYNIVAYIMMDRFSLDAEEMCEAYDLSEGVCADIANGTRTFDEIVESNKRKGLIIE